MDSSVTVSPLLVGRIALHAADRLSITPAEIARAGGIDLATLEDPEARLPAENIIAMWQRLEEMSGDPMVGLHAGERALLADLDVLGYALSSAETLADPVALGARYYALVDEVAEVKWSVGDDEGTLTYHVPEALLPLSRHRAECAFATIVRVVREATGAVIAPLAATFQHRRPDGLSEYLRVLGAHPRFGEPRSALVFARKDLERSLPASDPALHRMLSRQLAGIHARLRASKTCADVVSVAVLRRLADGEPALEQVAAALSLGERTLQRRLSDEGTSFSDVVDEVRRELADLYLAESLLAVSEIAFLLGFSAPSAFHRAFKRWVDTSPAEYRRHRSEEARARLLAAE